MKLDFQTAFQAAKMPALALIATVLIFYVLASFGLNLDAVLLPIQFAILAYAGYNGVKAFKLGIANGALAGAIASFLFGAFSEIVGKIRYFSDAGYQQALSAQAGVPIEEFTFYMVIGAVIFVLIISPILGFVFGAIGAYFAKKK